MTKVVSTLLKTFACCFYLPKDTIQKKLAQLSVTIARIEALFAKPPPTKTNIPAKTKLKVHFNFKIIFTTYRENNRKIDKLSFLYSQHVYIFFLCKGWFEWKKSSISCRCMELWSFHRIWFFFFRFWDYGCVFNASSEMSLLSVRLRGNRIYWSRLSQQNWYLVFFEDPPTPCRQTKIVPE